MRRLLATCCLFLLATAARAEIVNIDNATLARLLASGVPIIDIRTPPEWEASGVIAGSRLITFFDSQGAFDAQSWLGRVKTFARPEQPLIVICRSGNRTRAVSQFLSQQAGYGRVYNVTDGIRGWIAGGGTVVPAAPQLAACRSAGHC